jgi:hypothetical protein
MKTTTGLEYDPYQHADRLGVDVVYRKLRTGNGLWIPEIRTIFLQSRMRVIHERSVLTHELGHVCLGHSQPSERNELRADRWAVRQLIRDEEIAVVAAGSADPGVWCHELNVSADILERYLYDHRSA